MTEYEAIQMAASCKGQFPRMTTDQVDEIQKQLLAFTRGAAERALQDAVRTLEDWNSAKFLNAVRRNQLDIQQEKQRQDSAVRFSSNHSFLSGYELAERAAKDTPDEELRAMRDVLFQTRPDLADIYGKDVNPRKRRSLLVMMFAPASEAARGSAYRG